MGRATIYVPLLDEGTDVWAPVEAEPTEAGNYRIVGDLAGDAASAFRRGDTVLCRKQILSGGEVLVAYSQAS